MTQLSLLAQVSILHGTWYRTYTDGCASFLGWDFTILAQQVLQER